VVVGETIRSGPRAADVIMEAPPAVKFGPTVDDVVDTTTLPDVQCGSSTLIRRSDARRPG